jgi:hypothetical protein
MAETDLSGFNGDVTLPSAHGGEAKGFTVNRTMDDKDTSRYGGTRFAKFRGGKITISGDISVFLRMGAAGTEPGFTTPGVDGASLTLQLETGCTLVGTALFSTLNVNHEMGDPAIEGTHGYKFNGDVNETWAEGA